MGVSNSFYFSGCLKSKNIAVGEKFSPIKKKVSGRHLGFGG